MGELVRALLGYYRVRLRGAAPEMALNRLTREGVRIWAMERQDDFTCDVCVGKKDLVRLLELVRRAQHQGEVLSEGGLAHSLRGLKRRKLFVGAASLLLALAFYLTGFVWFLQVEGNETIPAAEILLELDDLGVGFGTRCRSIKPQPLKYKMLNRIPRLEWLTVTTSGGVATVTVRERPPRQLALDRRMPTNIVAARDCIIEELQVLSGQAVCQTGQTVLKGQLLVSGYADWGHCTQVSRALAEIYGRTWRRQNTILPAQYGEKTEIGQSQTRYAVEIGRKRINFYTDSGIWGADCDKMYERIPMELPGAYRLPVTWIRETATARTLEAKTLPVETAEQLLSDGARRAAEADMVAGVVVKPNLTVRRQADVYRLTGSLECREMVAKSVDALQFERDNAS